jgi:hypothetical protein
MTFPTDLDDDWAQQERYRGIGITDPIKTVEVSNLVLLSSSSTFPSQLFISLAALQKQKQKTQAGIIFFGGQTRIGAGCLWALVDASVDIYACMFSSSSSSVS